MPKQMLPLIEDHSMFRTSVERISGLFAPEDIFVVTGRNYAEELRQEVPHIPASNFIIEPYAKNTAPALALALATIQSRDPEAMVAILTADHHIADPDKLCGVLQAAREIAQDGRIVTLGISPLHPATGYGYIQQGPAIAEVDDFTVYQSKRFTEKPDIVRATQFLASGQYSWNSGMFIWKVSKAMSDFERFQPAIYAMCTYLQSASRCARLPAEAGRHLGYDAKFVYRCRDYGEGREHSRNTHRHRLERYWKLVVVVSHFAAG